MFVNSIRQVYLKIFIFLYWLNEKVNIAIIGPFSIDNSEFILVYNVN